MENRENADLTVKLSSFKGLDQIELGWIQEFEKAIDGAIAPLGFTRTTTTKAGDGFELNYRQFGKCQ